MSALQDHLVFFFCHCLSFKLFFVPSWSSWNFQEWLSLKAVAPKHVQMRPGHLSLRLPQEQEWAYLSFQPMTLPWTRHQVGAYYMFVDWMSEWLKDVGGPCLSWGRKEAGRNQQPRSTQQRVERKVLDLGLKGREAFHPAVQRSLWFGQLLSSHTCWPGSQLSSIEWVPYGL